MAFLLFAYSAFTCVFLELWWGNGLGGGNYGGVHDRMSNLGGGLRHGTVDWSSTK
jgi:hypothetical protein